MADTLLVRCGKAGGGKGALVQHELSATLSTSNVQTLFTDGGGHGRHCGGDWMDPRLTVRRLTPLETERLQGFPDGHTDIPYKGKDHPPDGLRYKATGNSMAVPVMAWIADGIVDVEFGTYDRRVHPWRPPTVDDVEPIAPGPLVWVDPANGGGAGRSCDVSGGHADERRPHDGAGTDPDVAQHEVATVRVQGVTTSNGDDVFPALCASDGDKGFIDNQSVRSGRLILG